MSDAMDRVSEAGHDAVLLAARVAMAAIFLPSGLQKITHIGAFGAMLAQHGVPGAAVLAPLGACVELFGSILILTGTRLRWAALLMALFTAVAALISHRFWEIADAAQRVNQHIHFMKNIAIIGGFLSLFVAGAGAYSVDAWLASRLTLARRWR